MLGSNDINESQNNSVTSNLAPVVVRTKRRVLAAMLATNVIAQMLYLNVASLLP